MSLFLGKGLGFRDYVIIISRSTVRIGLSGVKALAGE